MTIIGNYTLTAREVNGVKIYAPEEYWTLSEECKNKRGWDCGPGKTGAKLIPNTAYGLSLKEPCRVHDCMYALGKTKQDKWIADVVFLTNMNDTIESGASILKGLRRYRAMTYFSAVRDFGDSSFFQNGEGI